jgi:hypothetical protein
MMDKRRKLFLGMMACIIPIGVAVTTVSSQASAVGNAPAVVANGTVYQAQVACCQTIVLPAWPAAGHILTSKVIPVGTYSFVATDFVVIGPLENDNCWVATTNSTDVITQTGGNVGNGSTVSGTGAGGIYANAVINGTVVIKGASDHLVLYCDSRHFGQGTYVAAAGLDATKVPAIVNS